MYDNTSTRIKLIQKLSDHIILKNGVEQEHPLSPELFKIFIYDLSTELTSVKDTTPELRNININHLLWTDDLVLMGLSEKTLQKLIDIMTNFCEECGLTVNHTKTKVMIFNKAGRFMLPKNDIILNEEPIKSAKTYCYLGIVFIPSGKFKTALNELRKKALRSFFKLKSTVSRNDLSSKALFKLFDALILPILTYGCQVLFPETHFAKACTTKTKYNRQNWQQDWLSLIAKDTFESIHLKFIKWVIGVHKKASNIGCWGDSARVSLGITMMKMFFNYVDRVCTSEESSLMHPTFGEQSSTQLPWYSKFCQINRAYSTNANQSLQEMKNPSIILHHQISERFKVIWSNALKKSPKLSFYAKIKQKWGTEQYLSQLPFSIRKHLTRIRISSHRLPIETGRYSKTEIPREERYCELCKTKTNNQILLLGDEHHLIFDCLANKNAYHNVHDEVKLLISTKDTKNLFILTGKHLTSFGIYIKESYAAYLKHTLDTK